MGQMLVDKCYTSLLVSEEKLFVVFWPIKNQNAYISHDFCPIKTKWEIIVEDLLNIIPVYIDTAVSEEQIFFYIGQSNTRIPVLARFFVISKQNKAFL